MYASSVRVSIISTWLKSIREGINGIRRCRLLIQKFCNEEKGGSPVVKTPCFQCFLTARGAVWIPGPIKKLRCCMPMGMAKRERSIESGLKSKEI